MFLNEIVNLDVATLTTSDELKNYHKVLSIRDLSEDTFVLRLERKNIEFQAGQHIQLRVPGTKQFRIYSIYSGVQENFIEVLVKEIVEGYLTPRLRKVKIFDYLEIKKPAGHYILRPKDILDSKFLFIASRTGISPFHSYVLSFPQLNYKLLHGVRYSHEAYEKETFERKRLAVCTTGDRLSNFHGRVTQYLKENEVDNESLVYLCGGSEMINDSIQILKTKGFKPEQFFVESYF